MRLEEALVTVSGRALKDSWFSSSAVWVPGAIPVSVLSVFAPRAILLPGVLPMYRLETILFSTWASHFHLVRDVFPSKEMKLVLDCIAALVKVIYPYFQVFWRFAAMLGCSHFSKAKRLGCTSIPLGFRRVWVQCAVCLQLLLFPFLFRAFHPAMLSFHCVHNLLSVVSVVSFLSFPFCFGWYKFFCLQVTKSLSLCLAFYIYIPEF